MEAYAQILNFAIPLFITLILIEWLIGRQMQINVIRSFDTISSISSGITNSTKDVLGLSIIIISYSWFVEHLAIYEVKNNVLTYIFAFIGLDFAGYWAHRFEHKVNILWNRHIIHHSSEEFNLACALRQNISAIVAIFTFLYIPIAIIGVPAKVIAIVAPIHLFAQFWYHTRLINKMGFLEYIIVTPSHHRVHHAINDIYLDKNFSQIFIFWDKLFGTFQKELVTEIPVYGIKRQANTWNPILINYQHFWVLLKDAISTKLWSDKLLVWVKPTGWRPQDRIYNDPIKSIVDPSFQEKYDTPSSFFMKIWMWIQLVIHLGLMLYLFNNLSSISLNYILLYGIFLGTSVFSYTSLMDRSRLSYVGETLKVMIAIFVMNKMGGWYYITNFIPLGNILFVFYIMCSAILTIYFMKTEAIELD